MMKGEGQCYWLVLCRMCGKCRGGVTAERDDKGEEMRRGERVLDHRHFVTTCCVALFLMLTLSLNKRV